jgi:hypothetical protein
MIAAMAVMVLTATVLGLLLSDKVRITIQDAGKWLNTKPLRWVIMVSALGVALSTLIYGLSVIKCDVETGSGEPFAWLEGVSIWPTQILQMLLLILTGALLIGGRVWLGCKIDKVAKKFHAQTLSERENTPSLKLPSNIWARVKWLWDFGECPQEEMVQDKDATGPWEKFLEHMRRKPSVSRVVWSTMLFFLFSLALLSLDWPSSPHRGLLSAWFNHILQLLLLAAMTALLVSALDTSMMATQLLHVCLQQFRKLPCWSELVEQAFEQRDSAVDSVQCAAEITSAVNRLIYLPFLTFLLLVPTRSRVFDAWVLPLPYVTLILLAIGVALLYTIAQRGWAARQRAKILTEIDQKAERYALQAKLAQEDTQDASDVELDLTASFKADLLKNRADRLRAVRDGHFRPFAQEPVVRALLLLLSGTGTLTIIEFLLLGQS